MDPLRDASLTFTPQGPMITGPAASPRMYHYQPQYLPPVHGDPRTSPYNSQQLGAQPYPPPRMVFEGDDSSMPASLPSIKFLLNGAPGDRGAPPPPSYPTHAMSSPPISVGANSAFSAPLHQGRPAAASPSAFRPPSVQSHPNPSAEMHRQYAPAGSGAPNTPPKTASTSASVSTVTPLSIPNYIPPASSRGAAAQDLDDDDDDDDEGDDGSGGSDPSRKKRSRITPEQLYILERVFEIDPLPGPKTREQLASQLSLPPRKIQIWFQNKRAKMKKDVV